MGDVFAGRFQKLEPIAEGAMGSIWLVRDLRDGEVRAAKLLNQQDARSLLRFIREQATRIHHPHVVTPLGWAGEDDVVLFTMPLLRGGSVATLVGDYGALPETWVAELLGQALTGLAAVHAMGVVHRDVKPANLLLEHTGRDRPHLRISDFGVASPADQPRLTQPFVTLGTPGYLAPEQLRGADPHPRQDLYALGVTGLHLLTGTPPRDRAPTHDPAMLPDTALARALRQAVHEDPSQRPQTAGELAALVRTAVPDRPWDAGEVEVLDHFGDLTDLVEPTPLPGTGPAAATDHRPGPWWPIALLALLGAVLLVGGITLLL